MYLEKKEEVKAPAPSAGPSNISGKYMPPALRRNNERSSECMIINDWWSVDREEEEDYSVRILNVAEDVTDHQLRDLFRGYNYTKLRIITDFNTKRSRGFAFVNFATKLVICIRCYV